MFNLITIVSSVLILGIVIIVLIKTGFSKTYQPRNKITKEEQSYPFAYSGRPYFTKFDYLLLSISLMSVIFLVLSFLWVGQFSVDSSPMFFLWVQLAIMLLTAFSSVIFLVRFRLKNPIGKAQTVQIKTKGDSIRKTFIAIIVYCFVFLAILLLKYYS